jgi:hypothetical protein
MKLPIELVIEPHGVMEFIDGDGNQDQFFTNDLKELVVYANAYHKVKQVVDKFFPIDPGGGMDAYLRFHELYQEVASAIELEKK